MIVRRVDPAPDRPGIRGVVRSSLKVFGPALLIAAVGVQAAAAAGPVASTDTPIWRATHGLLLGIARAGDRLVAVGNSGLVLLSDDQGKTWRIAKSPTQELLTSVLFVSPKEGWAAGQDEEILHTTDGGETWTQQYQKPDADQVLFTLVSLAPNHLFSSGSYNLILETEDGVKWTESKVPNLDDDYHLNCAASRGDDLFLTGEAGHAFVRTGGGPWTPIKLPYDGSQFGCVVTTDGSFYSFGLRGTAFRMAPGSRSWTKLDTGTDRSIFGAALISDNRIALVGAAGLIMLLDPGNGHVTTLPGQTDRTLSGVVQGKDGQLIIVGEDGVHIVDPNAATAEAGQ